MKNFFTYGLLLSFSLLLLGCTTEQTQTNNDSSVSVVSTLPVLSSLTASVGGDSVEVVNLLPPGASPHLYSPTPSDLTALSNADAVVITGLGAEEFIMDSIENLNGDDATIIDLSTNIHTIASTHSHEHEDEISMVDAHAWLSIPNAMIMTQDIANGLSEIDPDNAAVYQANAEAYIAELEDLHAYATSLLSTVENPNFVPLHPAWIYFASEYNLNQVDAIELIPGQEPSAKQMTELIETIEEENVAALFSEPQLEDRIIDQIAGETGLPVYEVDPVGVNDFAESLYIDTMRTNVDTFAEALGAK